MSNDNSADIPLHAKKKVEQLQVDLASAKTKIAKDAKIPAIPHQDSDPDPAPDAEANKSAVGRQDIRSDDE